MDEHLLPSMQLPPALSTWASGVDDIFYFIFWVCVAFFFPIVGAMVYFMAKYRRRPGHKAEPTGHHNALELFWTFSPLILLFVMFQWGYTHYIDGAIAPDDAINIRVRGRQWAWSFEHANGVSEDNEVHVPAGMPVRFILSSEDVLHSFFIPDFRVKRDAVPGMFTSIWFNALERPDIDMGDVSTPDGTREWYRSQVYCAEYCGASGSWDRNAGHATMYAEIAVQRREDYEAFLSMPRPVHCRDGVGVVPTDCPPSEGGEALFTTKGCTACHQVLASGPDLAGPNFYGPFWGRSENLTDGSTVTIDDAYVRDSILHPRARVVAGYEPVMPSIRMTEPELDALVAYLQTL